jgi:carboxypeptidase family protein
MRVVICCAVLFLVTALAHPTPIHITQLSAPSPQVGRLRGAVLDQDGAPIVAAVIVIEGKKSSREVGYTEDGSYQVDLPAGNYFMTVRSAGFRPLLRRKVFIRAGSTRTINFRLKKL